MNGSSERKLLGFFVCWFVYLFVFQSYGMRFALRFLFEEKGGAWPKEPACFWGVGGDAPHLTTLQVTLSEEKEPAVLWVLISFLYHQKKKSYL